MFSGTFPRGMGFKIKKLSTAIFFDFDDSVLKLPNSIVKVLYVGQGCEIWFSILKPYSDVSGMEKSFPVSLHFYNKNFDYYINVEGIAGIVSNTNEIPDKLAKQIGSLENDKLLIRVKMDHLEYFLRRKIGETNFYHTLINSMTRLLYNERGIYSFNKY
jgi:hypothetical protein